MTETKKNYSFDLAKILPETVPDNNLKVWEAGIKCEEKVDRPLRRAIDNDTREHTDTSPLMACV